MNDATNSSTRRTRTGNRLPPATRRRGFTLLELLVVLGILAVLITLVGYAVTKTRRGADKFKLAAQLQTIETALEAYKSDWKSYPVTSSALGPTVANAGVTPPQTVNEGYFLNREGLRGARLLCKALMGQTGGQFEPAATPAAGNPYLLNRANQDGKLGLGFRVVGRSGAGVMANANGELQGKDYGPYLATTNSLRIANTAQEINEVVNGVTYQPGDVLPNTTNQFDDSAVLIDGNDRPILYFPCLNPQAPLNAPRTNADALAFAHVSVGRADRVRDTGTLETSTAAQSFAGTPMYNGLDNATWIPTDVFRILMGDADGNGVFEGAEKPLVRGRYLLWTAGPDGIFGPREADGKFPATTDPNRAQKIAQLVQKGYDDVTNFQGE